MKILFLIDTLQTGGAEKSLLEITRRFKKYEPIFIHLFEGDALKQQFQQAGIKVISLNLPISFRAKKIAKYVVPIVEEVQPVIIHSTLFHSDLVARHLRKKFNIPLINSLVNNSYSVRRFKELGLISKSKLFVIQIWDAMTSKNVDFFISNSHAIKCSNSRALRISLDKIKVIFRGRDSSIFRSIPASDSQEIRQNLGIGEDKVFLNVSRLLERKGQRDLLRAFKKVMEVFPDSKLLLAGEGPFRDVLEQEISFLGISKNVFLLGNRGDIPALLQMADFFVFPSHYEGLPGALIEAMMSKIPIVASKIAENQECVDERAAFLFNVQDIRDLSDNMIKVATDSSTYYKVDRAYHFALENFDIRKIAKDYENSYDNLLKSLS